MATVTTPEESTFVTGRATAPAWLGGTDAALDGTYTWDTGESFVYSAWAPGEPNNVGGDEDCLELRTGSWNDQSCGSPRGYVCEID